MGEIEKKWAAIHNAFDPIDPVPLDKLDKWYVERPGSPLRRLLTALEPEKLPQRLLMVGHRASGKSTELIKLSDELAKKYSYFVVYIPLDSNLDIEKVNPVEIIYLMGASLYKMSQEKLGEKPDLQYMNNLKGDLETIVTTYTENKKFSIDLGETLRNLACFAIGGLASVVLGAAGGALSAKAAKLFIPKPVVSSGISVEVARKREVEPAVDAMINHLNELIHNICDNNNCQLALIVDGLDKPYTSEVIALNFAQKRFLAQVDCRVVYAAPIEVYYSPAFASTRGIFPPLVEFPNVRLPGKADSEETEKEEGYNFLQKIIEMRVSSLGLKRDEVISSEALKIIIPASGGIVRDLVILIRQSAGEAEMAGKVIIDNNSSQKSAAYLKRLYTATLTPRLRGILQEVKDTRQRTDDPECDTLLRGNFILSYLNNGIWFDVHPLLKED